MQIAGFSRVFEHEIGLRRYVDMEMQMTYHHLVVRILDCPPPSPVSSAEFGFRAAKSPTRRRFPLSAASPDPQIRTELADIRVIPGGEVSVGLSARPASPNSAELRTVTRRMFSGRTIEKYG